MRRCNQRPGIATGVIAVLLLVAPPVGLGFEISPATDRAHNAGQSLRVAGELVTMTVVSADGGYDNLVSIASDAPDEGVPCHSVPPGFTVLLGRFATPTELVLSLATPVGEVWTTGRGADNRDQVAHARVSVVDPETVRVEWEDLADGGDYDYNDCVVTLGITKFVP